MAATILQQLFICLHLTNVNLCDPNTSEFRFLSISIYWPVRQVSEQSNFCSINQSIIGMSVSIFKVPIHNKSHLMALSKLSRPRPYSLSNVIFHFKTIMEPTYADAPIAHLAYG